MFGTYPALTGRFGELGLGEVSDDQSAQILNLVKQKRIEKRDTPTDREFLSMVAEVLDP